jgi:hypothetical protein
MKSCDACGLTEPADAKRLACWKNLNAGFTVVANQRVGADEQWLAWFEALQPDAQIGHTLGAVEG